MDYFELAAADAKSHRDRLVKEHPSSVVVVPMILGPDNQTMVPCGEVSFPRCVADQFEAGRLTVSSLDTGEDMRIYEPGTWAECTVYGPDDHILYGFTGRQ